MKTVLPVLLLLSLLLSTQSILAKQSTVLEEIIVTETRRDETYLQDTSISITSIGSEMLDYANVAPISELNTIVPNAIFNYWGTGKLSGYIGGVGAQFINWGEDARIGFYIDLAVVALINMCEKAGK